MKPTLKIIAIILFPFVAVNVAYQHDGKIVEYYNEEIPAYPEHIAGAYTGGFGEQSCHSCHFDYEINPPDGKLSISGVEKALEPGKEHTISISVKRKDMKRAGFQMTARFEDGSQAGHFNLYKNLTTTPNTDSEISYVQHGVGEVEAKNGEKSWQITWVAPDQPDTGKVIFNIAANAANGDASEFGDWIYEKEIRLEFQP